MENGVSATACSEIDGGPIQLGPSVFWHFQKSLENNAQNEAIIVAHQQSDHLLELTRSRTAPTTSTTPSEAQEPANDHSCLRWTYQQLHNAAVHLVHALDETDMPPGSTIVHLFPNSIEWCIIVWASKLGKFTQSALDMGLLTTPRRDELQRLLRMVRPDVIVVADMEGANALDRALEMMPTFQPPKLKVVLSSQTSGRNTPIGVETLGWISFLQLALSGTHISGEQRVAIEVNGLHDEMSRVSDIMCTSGTSTGEPKGCPRTVAGSLFAIAVQYWGPGCIGKKSKLEDMRTIGRDGAHQHTQPSRVRARIALAGQNFRIIAPTMVTSVWAAGGTIIMASAQPDFGALISAIPRFQIQSILMIPPGVNAIAAHADFASLDQSSLESVTLGGDIVTEAIFKKAARMFPNCEIVHAHGMTEGGSAFYHPYSERSGKEVLRDVDIGKDTSDKVVRFHTGIVSIGKVNNGTCLKIANEDNKSVARNQTGELHFSSPSIVRHYLNNVKPEDFYIEDFVDKGGCATHRQWFKSGDLGIIDQDGWVWILGRKKDVVKRMGVSVMPAALENSLNAFLSAETAIIPQSHEMLGQVPIAVVTANALATTNHSKADVENHILAHFGPESALGGVVTIEEIGFSSFPLNATGKIVKRELMEAATPFLEARAKFNGMA